MDRAPAAVREAHVRVVLTRPSLKSSAAQTAESPHREAEEAARCAGLEKKNFQSLEKGLDEIHLSRIFATNMIKTTYCQHTIKSEEKREPHRDHIEITTLVAPFQLVEIKYWQAGSQAPSVTAVRGVSVSKLIEMLKAVEIHQPK